MTLQNFIPAVCYALKGTDDTAPALGDDDWNYWVTVANRKKDEMYDDTKQAWASAWLPNAPNEPGTVTTAATTALVGASTNFTDYRIGDQILVAGETVRTILTITDDTHLTVSVAFSTSGAAKTFTHTIIIAIGVGSYNLHRTLINPDKQVQLNVLNTSPVQMNFYDVIKPQQRDYRNQQVLISGLVPKILTFAGTIITGDPIVGGSLVPSGFYRPADIDKTNNAAIIPVDDPNWLVMATAAQIAFNDITYEDKFADLNGQANALYQQMGHKNGRGVYGGNRISPTNVKRITGFH